jgi:DNA-binding response OmpR family regulator
MTETSKPSTPPYGRQVLLVEDSSLIALDLACVLEDAGYAVVGPAKDLGAALDLIDHHTIDAALLDVNLNGDTSFAAAEKLRDRRVPFVFLTGYSPGECLNPDFSDRLVVEKPVGTGRLLRIVEALLRERAASKTTKSLKIRADREDSHRS